MARKRKTAKGRLRQEFERARGPHLRDLLPKADYSDKRAREIAANIALTLTSHAIDAPLQTAFKEFGLDPLDPWNWRTLLHHLVRVTFPTGSPRARRGARPKWDERRRRLLEFHVAWARKRVKKIFSSHGKPPPTDEDIASCLIFTVPDLYGAIQPGTLRKYIASGPPKGSAEK